METVERDFSPKGVKFFYIYKALAHPETNGYITPFTLQERLLHVAEAKKKLNSRITWICDSMKNDLKHALGNAPNSEFVIGPDGKIVVARNWSRPQELREDLAKLVGEVDQPTTIADIGMKPLAPPTTAAKGVVPRVDAPGRMTQVLIEPLRGAQPFYAKLRAEIDQGYTRDREGTVYLGFFLDPLYKVHWNNRAAAIRYEISAPEGVEVSPAKGAGPEVEEDADADPREFLVKVSGRSRTPLELTVHYFACDDAETFCKPVTQRYQITLERDPDGGSRRSFGSRRGPPGGGRGPGSAGPRPAGPRRSVADAERSRTLREVIAQLRKFDGDADGKLNADEAKRMQLNANQADRDGDGQVTLRELIDWMSKEGK